MTKQADIFRYKAYLFTVGYNLTGDIALAEDLVKTTFEKWLTSNRADITNHKAYLSKILLHEGFKVLEKQKKEKEMYKGVWLPEPLISDESEETLPDPLDYAFLCLLEKLNPYERAVVVLKEGFDYSYQEIADLLDLKEDNCRQLLHRSKEKLKSTPKKKNERSGNENDLLLAFLQALQEQDLKSLEAMLLKDVAFYSDGGGKVPAALKPLFGFDKVVKFLLGVTHLETDTVFTVRLVMIIQAPGVIILANGAFNSMVTCEIADNKIATVYSIRNPEKIKMR